jgi:hypothetical protein
MLTGVSGSKGSETYPAVNTILKGTGNHTIKDSTLVDTGAAISTTVGITAQSFSGSLLGNASTATSASHALQADSSLTSISASHAVQANSSLTSISSSHAVQANASLTAISSSHAVQANSSLFANLATFATSSTSASHAVQADASLTSISASHAVQANSSLLATTASYATYATASTSASHAVQANASLTSTSASYAPTNVNDAHTFTNVNTFNGQVHGGVTALTITSNTASMDFQSGNFFTLTLQNAADTHLDATNVTAGQTITLTVTNNATAAGTLTFSPDFKFAGGTAPVVTATTSAKDILTFVTTDSTDVFGTSLLNFS